MTSPFVSMIAQEASWDSRTMVEKPVRKSEFCISCTMPSRLALMISISTASSFVISDAHRDEEVLELVHTRALADRDDGRRIELIDNGRSLETHADVQPLALIDW